MSGHGILLLDKGPGKSSAQALLPVKRAAGRGVRVGHAGTLDPFATGLLLVLVGDGTRVGEYALGLGKTYEATVRFGVETDTLDPTGEVVAEGDPGREAPADLREVLGGFVGEVEQVPPAHSALKIGGRRAYELARAGREVEVPPRTVRIDAIEILGIDWPVASLRVVCGSGTYLRSLARDIGSALEVPAHLTALRRTAIGPFEVHAAAAKEEVTGGDSLDRLLLPPLAVTRAAGLPEVALGSPECLYFLHGRRVPGARDLPDGTRAAVITADRPRLLGIADYRAGEGLRAAKVLASAQADLLG